MRPSVAALLAAVVLACSGSGDPAAGGSGASGPRAGDPCGPLRVVVDGQELTGLGPVYGVRVKKDGATIWHVETTDGPGHSCDEALKGLGRPVKQGENVIAADISSDRKQWTGVRHNAHALTAWKRSELVWLDGTPPAKVGDPIAICVDTDAVQDVAKGLSIRGALRGTYCGER
jgi:hypothetical protein